MPGSRSPSSRSPRITLPRRFSVPMREMLQLQPRFQQAAGAAGCVLLQHRRFRAAYDLLVLRTELGEVPAELADWWTRVQTLSPEEQRREFSGGRAVAERAAAAAEQAV